MAEPVLRGPSLVPEPQCWPGPVSSSTSSSSSEARFTPASEEPAPCGTRSGSAGSA